LDLQRVVVPTMGSPTSIPKPEAHNLRIAGLALGHGNGPLLPPQQTPLAALLDGLQELWMLPLPIEQRTRRDANLCRCCLGGQAASHGFNDLVAERAPIRRRSADARLRHLNDGDLAAHNDIIYQTPIILEMLPLPNR